MSKSSRSTPAASNNFINVFPLWISNVRKEESKEE
jgi:hypothetical protein